MSHEPECAERRAEWRWSEDCICDRLRACEQRCDKKGHAEVRAWSELSRDNFDAGYAAALNAAREAVAALDIGRDVRFSVDVQADAVAAIDALKEKP